MNSLFDKQTKEKKTFSTISVITVLCLVAVIVSIIAAIVSGKAGEWFGNKKNSNQLEINFDLLQERRKLKDYFVFNPYQEISNDYWTNKRYDLKKMSDELSDNLYWAIKSGGNQIVLRRRFMKFVGEFNIKSESDKQRLDNWIKNNPNIWIVISKSHYSEQFQREIGSFSLKKGEPDYHEFSSENEVIEWLRKNDSYFRS